MRSAMSLYQAPTPHPRGWARFWSRHPRRSPADPFATLAVQVRLAEVSALLRQIERDERMICRGERWVATKAAYDALIVDACGLAGVSAPTRPTEDERLRAELELVCQGWSW